ncbi:MAG: hypothetical protein WEF86_14540 [Gemmatimonadota bacterium]
MFLLSVTRRLRQHACTPAAFAALSDVVRTLESDPDTDWSRVDIEALRQHLIDMDEVTLNARVAATDVPGGARFEVTGVARAAEAIARMAAAHASQPDATLGMRLTVQPISGGVIVTATSEDVGDARSVARIRGLGFHGLLALGDHHAAHHVMIAQGRHADAHR